MIHKVKVYTLLIKPNLLLIVLLPKVHPSLCFKLSSCYALMVGPQCNKLGYLIVCPLVGPQCYKLGSFYGSRVDPLCNNGFHSYRYGLSSLCCNCGYSQYPKFDTLCHNCYFSLRPELAHCPPTVL